MTNLDRVVVTCYRVYCQVQRINGLTIVMRGVHLGLAVDVVVFGNRVINTRRAQDTVVEAIDLSFADVCIEVLMERVCINDIP